MTIDVSSHNQKFIFDERNNEKYRIHTRQNDIGHINIREIWYVKLGINVGFEQNGKKYFRRPAMILKKIGNMFLIMPLTTKGKESVFYYHLESFEQNGRASWLIISQIKSIDKRRFMDKIGMVSEEEFIKIKKLLTTFYFA